ncbi:MAG: tyrosine-type recombinase/integrase [Nitrospirales bacterium]|nr:tyrosine-type recombinase/integrase [Nitrospirales bacterium]
MKKYKKAEIENGPWNKGKAVDQMTPFYAGTGAGHQSLLTTEKKIRDLALFNVGIDTMLRASDLLRLLTGDVTDHHGNVVSEINIRQKKTNRGHLVALSPETRDSLADWILHSGKKADDYLWTSIAEPQNPSTPYPRTICQLGQAVGVSRPIGPETP